VRNDPLNGFDPWGLRCERGDDGELNCTVEIAGNQSEAGRQRAEGARSRVERQYTRVARHLDANRDRTVTIAVGGSSFETTAGAVVDALIETDVFLNGDMPSERADGSYAREETGGGALNPARPRGMTITWSGFARNNNWNTDGGMSRINRDLRRTFVHGGFHLVPEEAGVAPELSAPGGVGAFQANHRDPYNNAADTLLGGLQ
jgi:hypothetical protein